MAEVTSGNLTVIALSTDEAAALATVLEDWRNTALQNIEDGYDPHGYTRAIWNNIKKLAQSLDVDTDLELEMTNEGSAA